MFRPGSELIGALARDLVTNAGFAAFVDAGAYETEALWTSEGFDWLRRDAIDGPRFWADPDWSHFQLPEQPVVGVSWYEADAYCRWLGARLPRESEWEAAVRGDDGRLFPWGPSWQEGVVGNRGVGERTTWPIGHWPASNGPFGHRDLVGNVWQWTSDAWAPNDERRAVRGGSWASPNHQLRADHRNGYPPTARPSHVGFRVAARASD